MVAAHRSRQIASMAVASLPFKRGMMHSSRQAAIDFMPGRNRNRYPMPVMPPVVSTSQTRISRVAPSAAPFSQGSSAQGTRSIVTLMLLMVISGLVIGCFPYLPDHVDLISGQGSQSQMAAANPARYALFF